jgi:hypothetical protein
MADLSLILNKIDISLISIFLTSIISLYGIVLFGYEWWRRKQASFIFKSVTFLFVGQFIDNCIGFYGRWLSLFVSFNDFATLRLSPVWAVKDIITGVVLFVICWYMTKKMKQSMHDAEPAYEILDKQRVAALNMLNDHKNAAKTLLSEQRTAAFKLLGEQKLAAHTLLENQVEAAHTLLEEQIQRMFNKLKNN